MPNRSIGELVCRVPLIRGSLLKSLENLVKTIETSENAVMIPTLLRDKVRVDAWELLFAAKILKASILGHDDLVEFYMNHIHQNSLSTTMGAAAAGLVGEPALSPSLARQQSSPTMSSPKMSSLTTSGSNNMQATSTLASPLKDSQDNNTTTNNHHSSTSLSTSSNHSSQSTASSSTATTTGAHNQTGQTNKSSSASWITAQQSSGASLTSGSPFNSPACSSSSSTASSVHTAPLNKPTNGAEPVPVPVPNPNAAVAATIETVSSTTTTTNNNNNSSEQPQIASLATPLKLAPEEPMQEGLLAARPLMARLAQPPSLLQLTTTNNHINSVSEMLNSSPLDPSLDLLSQHLISLQQQQLVVQANGFEPSTGSNLSLSISTNGQAINGGLPEQTVPSSLQHLLPSSANSTPNQSQPAAPPTTARHELRSSRSAGCLFRANSGASSPRTPGTPYPQAETLAGSANQNGLVGEPTSLVKLLLQVEQLKASIVHVNTLLESVVELYKKSIDNISQ